MAHDSEAPCEPRSFDTSDYDREGSTWLFERMGKIPLVVQGPMGSLLQSQVGAGDIPPAYWNIADPEEVARFHWLYRAAGADIVITNTFQASEPALARDEVAASVARVNRQAVWCAKRAGAPCVLGSVGPCGLTWLVEDSSDYRRAKDVYRTQAYELLAAGVHGILLETFTSIRDLQPALAGALEVADGQPVLVSFSVDDAGNLLGDGLNIEAACMYAAAQGAAAVGVNCCSIPAATAAVPRMVRAVKLPVMVRPHAGFPRSGEDGSLAWSENPQQFAAACAQWCADGATLVGSCCGAGPQTTGALAGFVERTFRL